MKSNYFKEMALLFDSQRIDNAPKALEGLKVLEAGTLVLGPELPSNLAEFGAEVIKVEPPGAGDTMRSLTPYGYLYKNQALGFAQVAINKKHCTIDLRTAEGVDLFKKLAAKCDVVVENFRSGTMDKWGIGYKQLKEVNPELIYVALNGFGQWGVYTDRPAYDAVAQSESGFAGINGFPESTPMKVGIWIADHFGALMGTNAVLTALHYKKRTGKGQFIEFSQVENLMRVMGWTWPYLEKTKKNRERTGNTDVAIVPSGIFYSKDRMQVAVASVTDEGFAGLATAMNSPDLRIDSRFKTQINRAKPENAKILNDMLANWVSKNSAQSVETAAGKYGFSAHRVYSAADQATDSHLQFRGFVHKFTDPKDVKFGMEGPEPHLSLTPGEIKWVFKEVGADNNYVFKKFIHLTDEEYKELEEKKVIGSYINMMGRTPPIEEENKEVN